MVYYNADYYYQSEEVHEVLKEAAMEYGAKYGKKVDATKRDKAFRRDYLTGTPNYNDKWNFMAENMNGSGKLMDLDAVPPKDFSLFYKQGLYTNKSVLIIGGKDWSERISVSFDLPNNTESYYYLFDLFRVSKEKDKNFSAYNQVLNRLVIIRMRGDSRIVVKRRKW